MLYAGSKQIMIKMLDRVLSLIDGSKEVLQVLNLSLKMVLDQASSQLWPFFCEQKDEGEMAWMSVLGKEDACWRSSEGSNIGILGYLSQSNDNSDCVPVNDRYKYMDDLTIQKQCT